MQKKIAHIDMDAYYVSIEIRDNPSLANKPVAVGGKSNRRGVLSTCNYIARQYGVSSAMPIGLALKKCPDLVVVQGRMEVYKETSQIIHSIFEKYTDKIEPLSLDEAYLDLSESSLHQGSATLIAQEIREEILKATGLTASAGIAPLKFVAKIASDLNKPNGQCTIVPENIWQFLETLPLKKIPGVGKVTFDKLKELGFETCGDIRRSDEGFLASKFGKYGHVLWKRSHGIDDREVQVSHIRKSVGVERTFEFDISEQSELESIIVDKLLPELRRRSSKYLETRAMSKLGVKVKFNDFQQTTKDQKASEISLDLLKVLLLEAMSRGKGKPVRLLGIHIGLKEPEENSVQLGLEFD
ncbi:DNA polymerase IV [Litorilituus sediminis]|uniref:DNA polymerase IV n=1 Tax=Litorilituus sediminis TaxID=718192 RepID=A0A4P6P2Q4_9GAMM|nr:DNA polymerase IV [Litorilituus sediminis]QBG35493.1 DNA polymerase IV [Litorilituus sediminis]